MTIKLRRALLAALMLPAVALAAGCSPQSSQDDLRGSRRKSEPGKADSSAEAAFLDFSFDASLVTTSTWNPKSQIEDQLLYTMGLLNGERSVGRLDKLELTNVQSERIDGGKTRVSYHAKLLVAWGSKTNVPESFDLVLPKDVSYSGVSAFTEKYKHDCVDWGAHDVDTGSMWYYFRPNAYSCHLADEDVVRATATVTPSAVTTTGKFPEYDKVWEDNVLRVVAVFGKYEDGATSGDAGISGYNRFVGLMQTLLRGKDNVETVPAEVPSSPGVDAPDIEFHADLPGGRKLVVVALLVDNVRTAGATFNNRYADLSSHADLISYSGHAGLGANVKALARKGRWVQGQYAVVFMNGCDTYAYVDDALVKAHAAVNPDDPKGTKYVDIVTNAMPSYFSNMANATMAIVRGLLSVDEPKTFEQIFADIDRSQVVLVLGEEDNTYTPGGGGDPDPGWQGLSGSGNVARNAEDHYETPTLPAGTYIFDIDGSGDADLYVRIGDKPTTGRYDCRPYRYGSKESCKVEIREPAPIYVMVRGWDASSDYTLSGRAATE